VNLGLFHPGNTVGIEAWVNLDPAANNNPSYNAIVARWDGSFELDVAPGDVVNLVVRNQANELGVVAAPSPLTRGQWYHVVGVYGGGLLQLYINGSQVASQPFAGTLRNGGPSPDRVLIGATRDGSNGSYQWKGSIDEVAIYDYAISPAQVMTHYLAAAPPPMALNLSSPAGVLTWPNYEPAYVLQTTDSLQEPVQWHDDPSPRATEGKFYKVTISLTAGQHFYRLIRR
jgi:hypothetical protein